MLVPYQDTFNGHNDVSTLSWTNINIETVHGVTVTKLRKY